MRPRRRCLICDKSFIPARSDAVTCSSACRQQAYRIRKKIGGAALRLIRESMIGPHPSKLVVIRNARVPPRGGWKNSGVGGPGWAMTFRTSEAPRNPVTRKLSEILEPGPVDPKYDLSPRAAAGILRRAERRGMLTGPPLAGNTTRAVKRYGMKKIPPALEAALRRVAAGPGSSRARRTSSAR